MCAMGCDSIREALSAALDGELSALERRAVDAHLGGCGACRAHAIRLDDLHRMTRVRPADVVPDLTAPIMAAVDLPRVDRHDAAWARYALFAVAATQLVLALPAFLLGNGAGTGGGAHVARELGAFDVALATCLVVAAWQPRRAAGLLPVAAAVAAAMLVGAVADVAGGRAPMAGEAHHVLEVLGLLFLWLVARVPGASRPRRQAALAA